MHRTLLALSWVLGLLLIVAVLASDHWLLPLLVFFPLTYFRILAFQDLSPINRWAGAVFLLLLLNHFVGAQLGAWLIRITAVVYVLVMILKDRASATILR